MFNSIKDYGYTEFYEEQVKKFQLSQEDLVPGRVIEVHREQYKIITELGENKAKLKASLFYKENVSSTYPAVGDFVLVKPNSQGEDIIYYTLDRKSKFSRLDSFHNTEQVVATNFDYVFIVTSLNHDFNPKRIDRYLTIAWQSGAMPVIVFTKLDLCENHEDYMEQIKQRAPGIPVIAVSAHTGEGMEELKALVKPYRTIVFLGSSGVGKSSLVNAMAGEGIMKVNTIREDDSKGRHTTTHRQLIMLSNGTMIIDTPGMRELGMWEVSEGLETTFAEIEAFAKGCRFRDCTHQKEPGCEIQRALEAGEISKERWNNYLKLQREAKFAEQKENANTRLKEKARQKNLSKFQKEFYKKNK